MRLGFSRVVGLLGADPSLREDVPDGAGEGLVALTWTGGRRIGDVVKQQMPVIERISVTRELDRTTLVLPTQGGRGLRGCCCSRSRPLLADCHDFSKMSRGRSE